jgi:hypothetical protein
MWGLPKFNRSGRAAVGLQLEPQDDTSDALQWGERIRDTVFPKLLNRNRTKHETTRKYDNLVCKIAAEWYCSADITSGGTFWRLPKLNRSCHVLESCSLPMIPEKVSAGEARYRSWKYAPRSFPLLPPLYFLSRLFISYSHRNSLRLIKSFLSHLCPQPNLSQQRLTCLLREMTSYTQIKEGVEPSIFTSPKHVIADINPLIYGGFTEYVYLLPLSNTIILPYSRYQFSYIPTEC